MVHPLKMGCIINNPLERRLKAKTSHLAFNIFASKSHHLNITIACKEYIYRSGGKHLKTDIIDASQKKKKACESHSRGCFARSRAIDNLKADAK